MSKENDQFDIFLSYNWDVKDKVKNLYNKLTNDFNLRVWIDYNQLDNNMLYDQLTEGIRKSTLFLCCVTKKYTESVNCIRELNFASESKKTMIILMFERLQINEIGSVGFIISPLTRFNCYNDKNIFYTWCGPIFDTILKSINNCLNGITESKWDTFGKKVSTQIATIQVMSILNENKDSKKATITLEEKKDKLFILRKQSNTEFNSKNFTSALDKINQAIDLDPSDKTFYLMKSKILNQLENYDEACQVASSALEIDSNYTEAQLEKAFALNELGNKEFESDKFNIALSKYNEAITLNPTNKIYYSNKAGCLKNLERYAEAIQALDIALRLDPNYRTAMEKKASALNALATVNFQNDELRLSLIRYDEAIRLNPNEKVYYANKAGLLIKMSEWKEAIKIAELALKIDPNYEYALEKKKFAESKISTDYF